MNIPNIISQRTTETSKIRLAEKNCSSTQNASAHEIQQHTNRKRKPIAKPTWCHKTYCWNHITKLQQHTIAKVGEIKQLVRRLPDD